MSGFEKMERNLSERYTDRASPVAKHIENMHSLGASPGPLPLRPDINGFTADVVKMFAHAAQDHMAKVCGCLMPH
jgi:sterol carrier protein 2